MDKRALLILAGVAVLAGVFIQTFNNLAGKHREQVQQELYKVLGTDISYERLAVSLWGGLGFSAHGFRMADDARFAATPLVYATELNLGVSWWNLLLGRIVIDSMTLKEPEFQIITDELGSLNLTAIGSRRKAVTESPKPSPPPAAERHRVAVSFAINSVRVKNGRIDYIDRSVREPAELQIKKVEMAVRGFEPGRPSSLSLSAALTEALDRDVRIEGTVGPVVNGRPWSHQPLDVRLQFDSLYVPLLGRAVAFLRNKIPRELDVTGPMSLKSRLSGTLAKPVISDLTLNVPLFGSSDYNAVLAASIDFSQTGSWPQAQLQGKLRLEGIDVRQLRRLEFFKNHLPAGFAGEGMISLDSRFEGSWEKLRVGALVRADETELHFADWLRKPAGTKARLEAKIWREKDTLVLDDSRLIIGESPIMLTGRIDDLREPRSQVRFHTTQNSVAAWAKHFSPLDLHGSGGTAAWDIVASRNAALPEEPWSITGGVAVNGATFRHQRSGRTLNDVSADIVFLGSQVRVDRASFRLGSSLIALSGYAEQVGSLPLKYRVRSTELNLLDLSQELALPAGRMRGVSAEGSIDSQDGGATIISGSLVSAEGAVRDIPYRNLRADVSWSAGGLAFNNLALHVFNGMLYSDGLLATADHGFDIASRLQSADVGMLLLQIVPQLKYRIEGQLDFRGRFSAAENGNGTKRPQPALNGSGDALIGRGLVKHFNLLSYLFAKGSGPDPKIPASVPAALSELAKRTDTPFDSLKARVIVERRRLRTENVVLSTPEYSVTGAGWVGFDRTVKWSGSLTLSPRVTQELQREFAALRFFVDRRGRLSFSFGVEGKLPNVKLKHENRAVAQILRLTAAQEAKPGAAIE